MTRDCGTSLTRSDGEIRPERWSGEETETVCEVQQRLGDRNARNAGVAGQVADLSNRGGSNWPTKTEKRGWLRKQEPVWKQQEKKGAEGQEEERTEEDEEGEEVAGSSCSAGGDGPVHVAGPAATWLVSISARARARGGTRREAGAASQAQGDVQHDRGCT